MTELETVHPDAVKWNGRYQTEGEKWQSSRPRQLLLDTINHLPTTGLALDAAAGVGVHSLFLAERNWHVIALDISEMALRMARQQALLKKVKVETAVFDLSADPWLPENTFDLILNFRFLERGLFAVYRKSLKPGGWLIFETFIRPHQNVADPEYFLEPGEINMAFSDFEIIHSAQIDILGQKTGKIKRVEQLVARKT